jgi:hypothetical protein
MSNISYAFCDFCASLMGNIAVRETKYTTRFNSNLVLMETD